MTIKESQKYYKSWFKFSGRSTSWTKEKIQTVAKEMEKSNLFNQEDGGDEAFLYMILYSNGLLTTSREAKNYFIDKMKEARSQSGIGQIKKDEGIEGEEDEEKVKKETEAEVTNEISPEQAKLEADQTLGLKLKKSESVSSILKRTKIPDALLDDFDRMDAYLSYLVKKLWNKTFEDESTVDDVKKEVNTGDEYRQRVVSTFLKEYSDIKKLQIPHPWITELVPNLMQRYLAYKIKKEYGYGNLSEPGTGKTLSAILASRVIDSKLTLILCPNHIVKQWIRNIQATLGEKFAHTTPKLIKLGDYDELDGRPQQAFHIKADKSKHQYLVINYDQLNLPGDKSKELVLKLGKQKIDFIILDEFQSVKLRGEETKRRTEMKRLLVKARKTNPKLRVTGLSATPVINEIVEGISLLELLKSEDLSLKLSPNPTIPNAVSLYSYIMSNSIRQRKDYNIKVIEEQSSVHAPLPDPKILERLNNSRLSTEIFLTDARIPMIIKKINGQTVIYTDNVGTALHDEPTIIEKLENALKNKGYSYAMYTGDRQDGFDEFIDGERQVLIASAPIAVGVDRLQYKCSNLIFNTLPWTHAGYQQIVGRIARQGQTKPVNIHIIKSTIGLEDDPYTPDDDRLLALNCKRELADCAVDGVIPIGKSFETRKHANAQLMKMLTRISKGEISIIPFRALESDLTEEVKKITKEVNPRRRKTEISKFHKLMNKMTSKRLEKYFSEHLDEAKRYHQIYRAHRKKDWRVIPYEVIIDEIKHLGKNLRIGDFGCGEGQIGDAFPNRVKSFDLYVIGSTKKIIQCNVIDVSEYVKRASLNIVVFCLSLHCTDWKEYIKEANRCLPKGGQVFIAMTKKQRLGSRKAIDKVLENNHFKTENQYPKDMFWFIEARKL